MEAKSGKKNARDGAGPAAGVANAKGQKKGEGKDEKERKAAEPDDAKISAPALPPPIADPERKLYKDNVAENFKYYKLPGSESWLWEHAKLHTAVPGKVQCHIPKQQQPNKDGSNPLCLEWLSFSSAGSIQNHARGNKHRKWFDDHEPKPDDRQTNRGQPSVTKFVVGQFDLLRYILEGKADPAPV